MGKIFHTRKQQERLDFCNQSTLSVPIYLHYFEAVKRRIPSLFRLYCHPNGTMAALRLSNVLTDTAAPEFDFTVPALTAIFIVTNRLKFVFVTGAAAGETWTWTRNSSS